MARMESISRQKTNLNRQHVQDNTPVFGVIAVFDSAGDKVRPRNAASARLPTAGACPASGPDGHRRRTCPSFHAADRESMTPRLSVRTFAPGGEIGVHCVGRLMAFLKRAASFLWPRLHLDTPPREGEVISRVHCVRQIRSLPEEFLRVAAVCLLRRGSFSGAAGFGQMGHHTSAGHGMLTVGLQDQLNLAGDVFRRGRHVTDGAKLLPNARVASSD